MKKGFMKYSILIGVGMALGIAVSNISNVFGAPGTIEPPIDPSTRETITNIACIEYTTPSGTGIKCDDVDITYADDAYPVKKRQKTEGMSDFTDDEITVELGEYILYKVDFVNSGDESLVGMVKDYLPNCITFITGSIHGDGVSNASFEHNSSYTQVRFKGISLFPGRSGYMLVTGQVSNSENCQNVTRYTNTGSFKSTNPSGTELFDSVVAKRPDQGNPKLDIEKKILTEQYLQAGETVAYKITVKNVGSGTATGVRIYDELPIEIQYQTSTIDLPSYSTYYFATNTTGNTVYIYYTGITLEPEGKATVYLTGIVREGHTFNDGVENCARASRNNEPEVKICVTPNLPKVYMEKELLTTGNISEGEIVVYRINVWNSGLAEEPNLEIYDELPIQVEYLTSSISINPDSAYHFATDSTGDTIYINYTGINLAANGGRATVYLTGRVRNGYLFNEDAKNCATVSGENTPEIKDCATPGPKPEVHVKKELLTTGNLISGSTVVYRINVWNSGGAAESSLEIYDELPAIMQYIASSISINPDSQYYFKTGTTGQTIYILYTGITLDANGTATVYLTGKVKPGHIFDENTKNCAIVSGIYTHRTSFCVSPEPKPKVYMEKELLTTGYLGSGSTVVYRIIAWNSGGKAATGLEIYDELPEIMEYLTSSIVMYPHSSTHFTYGFTGNGNNRTYILYTGVDLEADGGRATIYLTGKVKPGHEFNVNTENCATISGQDVPEIKVCVTPTPPTPITTGDIIITKSVNKYYVKHGDVVRYTIQYHNKSDRPLYDYTIVDNRPSELIFSGANPQESTSGGNTITWISPEYPLYPHSTGTITITGVVR